MPKTNQTKPTNRRAVWVVEIKHPGQDWEVDNADSANEADCEEYAKELAESFPTREFRPMKYVPEQKP